MTQPNMLPEPQNPDGVAFAQQTQLDLPPQTGGETPHPLEVAERALLSGAVGYVAEQAMRHPTKGLHDKLDDSRKAAVAERMSALPTGGNGARYRQGGFGTSRRPGRGQ